MKNPTGIQFLVIDLFCGAGGTTTGAEMSGVAKVIAAINHDPLAISSHAANHQNVMHMTEDILVADTRPIRDAVTKWKRIYPKAKTILWASLECFPADTMLLTTEGLKPIQEVKINDKVLTHTGKWQRVTTVMQKISDTVVLRGQGHPGLVTTKEHPFYAKQQTKVWNNSIRQYRNVVDKTEWIKADFLTGNKHTYRWATPVTAEKLNIPKVEGRGMNLSDKDFWWMVGRWIGGGLSAPHRSGQISIVCKTSKAEELAQKLKPFQPKGLRAEGSELRWQQRPLKTGTIFYCTHLYLSKWLIEHFGKRSYGKTIPAWALTMPDEYKQALIDGYTWKDEHKVTKRTQVTTVSKRLGIGVRLLTESLGYRASLHEHKQHSNAIEGRAVNGKNVWVVDWDNNKSNRGAFQDDLHAWSLVKEKTEGGKGVTVYNLSVEEDESYIADGIVVHNCTNFSNAKGGLPRDADSRSLAQGMFRYIDALNPDYFLIENVREFMAWGDLDENRKPVSKLNGREYVRWVKKVQAYGYKHDWRLLCAANFGGVTIRERYFGAFWKPCSPFAWPQPTHAKKPAKGNLFADELKPWRAVAEVLDFSDLGKSIFDRPRPLVDKTLRRILAGLKKFHAQPTVMVCNSPGYCQPVTQPVGTLTTVNSKAILTPILQSYYSGANNVSSTDRPAPTVTTRDRFALVTPWIDRNFRTGRSQPVDEPAGALLTVPKMNLCTAFLVPSSFDNSPRSITDPAPTLLASRKHINVATAFIVNPQYSNNGSPVTAPAPTVIATQKSRPLALATATTDAPPRWTITGADSPAMIDLKTFMRAHGIADIFMRMLHVKELKLIQGFPADYVLHGPLNEQKKFIGNSVETGVVKAWILAIANENSFTNQTQNHGKDLARTQQRSNATAG